MSVDAATLTHVTIASPGAAVDVAVPAGVQIGSVLEAAGLASGQGLILLDGCGEILGDDALVGVGVAEGQVVVPVLTQHAAGGAHQDLTEDRQPPGTGGVVAASTLVACAAGCALAAAILAAGGGLLPPMVSAISAAGLVAGGLIAAWLGGSPASLLAATAAAACGAGLAVAPQRTGGLTCAVAVCAVMAVALAVRYVRDPQARDAAGIFVGCVAAVAIGSVLLGAVAAGLSVGTITALTYGALPLVLRLLPLLCAGVPATAMVDVARWSQFRVSVRGYQVSTDTHQGLTTGERLVCDAGARLRWGVWILAALAVVTAPLSSLGVEPTLAHRGAWVAMAGCGAAAFLVGARPLRDAQLRAVCRGAGVVVVFVSVIVCVRWWGWAGALSCGTVLAVLGLVQLVAVVPASRGVRWLGLSRMGDMMDGLATLLALPCALLASGVVDLLRTAAG